MAGGDDGLEPLELDLSLDDVPDDDHVDDPPARERDRKRMVVIGLVVLATIVIVVGFVRSRDSDGGEEPASPPSTTTTTAALGPTGLALEDPEALGFTVTAAIDGPNPDESRDDDSTLTAVAPVDAEDPWASAATITRRHVGVGDYEFLGEVIDLGERNAALERFPEEAFALRWQHGDDIVTLRSANLDLTRVINAVRAGVTAGYDGTGPPPGFRVLHEGPRRHFQLEPNFTFVQTDQSVLAYEHPDDLDFILRWQAPGDVPFLAPLIEQQFVGHRTIRGRSAVVTTTWWTQALTTLSWQEADGTTLRLSTYGDIDELLRLIDGELEPLGPASFAFIAGGTDLEDHRPLITPPDGFDAILHVPDAMPDPATPGVLSTVNVSTDDTSYWAAILERPHYSQMLQLHGGHPSGRAGTGLPIPGTDVLALRAGASRGPDEASDNNQFELAGVVPPDLSDVVVTDRNTREELSILAQDTAPIDGTDWQLLLTVVHTDRPEPRLEVTLRTANGNVRRYWP